MSDDQTSDPAATTSERVAATGAHDIAQRARALLDEWIAAVAGDDPEGCGTCPACGRWQLAHAALRAAAPSLARDVLSLADDLAAALARADAADARTAALTLAVRDHLATQYRVDNGRDANRAVLDALLDGASSGVVSAAVVRAYRDALDAYEGGWALDSDAPERTELDAARDALDTALAGCL